MNSMSTDAQSPPMSQEKVRQFNTGRWSKEEHEKFMEGLQMYGKDWKKVQEYVGTRSSTQARSHA